MSRGGRGRSGHNRWSVSLGMGGSGALVHFGDRVERGLLLEHLGGLPHCGY